VPDTTVPTTATLVVMGVSGSGKTTLAMAAAERLGWPFAEGDDLHPAANVEKMRSGTPLDDDDRWPWLDAVAGWIGEHEGAGRGAVVTCSALKRSYRDLLRAGHPSVSFVHVTVTPETLRRRLAERTGHYLPASLLDSQLATLEPLQPDEPGLTLPGDAAPEAVLDDLLAALPARS
jgi:gluconokinase